MAGEKLPVSLGGILGATIGMMNAAWRSLSALDCGAHGGARQAGIDRAADGVADDHARPDIENDGDVDEAELDMSEQERPERERTEFDVVIIFAGPAGLSAAIRLKQVNSDLTVGVPI